MRRCLLDKLVSSSILPNLLPQSQRPTQVEQLPSPFLNSQFHIKSAISKSSQTARCVYPSSSSSASLASSSNSPTSVQCPHQWPRASSYHHIWTSANIMTVGKTNKFNDRGMEPLLKPLRRTSLPLLSLHHPKCSESKHSAHVPKCPLLLSQQVLIDHTMLTTGLQTTLAWLTALPPLPK
jgi:hypothetical protein